MARLSLCGQTTKRDGISEEPKRKWQVPSAECSALSVRGFNRCQRIRRAAFQAASSTDRQVDRGALPRSYPHTPPSHRTAWRCRALHSSLFTRNFSHRTQAKQLRRTSGPPHSVPIHSTGTAGRCPALHFSLSTRNFLLPQSGLQFLNSTLTPAKQHQPSKSVHIRALSCRPGQSC